MWCKNGDERQVAVSVVDVICSMCGKVRVGRGRGVEHHARNTSAGGNTNGTLVLARAMSCIRDVLY